MRTVVAVVAATRRWKVPIAFFALTVAFTVGLVKITSLDRSTRELAQSSRVAALAAQRSAAAQAAESKRLRALRAEQLHLLHKLAVQGCRRHHRLTRVVENLDKRFIKQSEQQAAFPGLTPEQERILRVEQRRSLATLKKFLADLQHADCTRVPQLPTAAG